MGRLCVIFILLLMMSASVSLAQEPSPVEQNVNRMQTVLQLVIVLFPVAVLLAGYWALRRMQSLNQRINKLETEARASPPSAEELKKITSELEKVKQQLAETSKRVRETTTVKTESAVQTAVTQSLLRLEQTVAKQRDESVNAIRALSLLPGGERQYRVKDVDGALDTYKRALEMDDNNPTIHYRLGYIYTQGGHLQEGQAHLSRALAIDPDFAPAMAALGYCRRRIAQKLPTGPERERQLDEAESMLLKALSISPKLVDEDGESWWGALGGLYRDRGKIDQATKAYENAAVVTPYSSYPLNNLALLYLQTQGREAMLDTYRRSERVARFKIQATPDDYWPYADLLVARVALGKTQEAEDALKLAIELLPIQLPYAAQRLIETLEDLGQALGADATHVAAAISYIKQGMNQQKRTTSTDEITKPIQAFAPPNMTTQISLQNKRDKVRFPDGQEAVLVQVSDGDNPSEIVKLLGLEVPQPSIFMLVGAIDMESKEMAMTRPILEDGLAKFAHERRISVVDGGTSSGVMQLMGQARQKSHYEFPLIGVAPANQVKYPGHDNPAGYTLDSGHSHFVLTQEGEFGDETDMIVDLSYALTGQGQKPHLGMIVNGGDIVRQEVYRLSTEPNSTLALLVLEGSGRFADELAAAKRTGHTDNDVLKAIVEKGRVELVSVNDGPEALRARLVAFFGTPQEKQPT